MASNMGNKKTPTVTVTASDASDDSDRPRLQSPRVARFAEATSVDSPIEPPTTNGRAFNFPQSSTTQSFQPQLQPGDVGFGYVSNDRRSMASIPHVEMPGNSEHAEPPRTPAMKSPLKSALKSPGMKSQYTAMPKSPMFAEEQLMSPVWREEKLLEKREARTSKIQQDDLRVKLRVRMAKLVLRFTNFSCSLIVLAMIGTVLMIFNASVNLPPRNNLPAWAPNTPRWPQITILCIACVSLFCSVVILIAYCKKGHKRAEKWAAYYSIMAVGFFVVSIIMWATGAGIFQHAKHDGEGKDMWGWSCKTNNREKIFGNDVNYALLCRLQNWSLVCCIIEVVVEVITILVYGIVFYRYWSKRTLKKTMEKRDKARSELYLKSAALDGSFPRSPGVPLSPGSGGYNPAYSPRFAPGQDAAEKGNIVGENGAQFTSLAGALAPAPEKKFTLSKPPVKSPKTLQTAGFSPATTFSSVESSPETPQGGHDKINEHVAAAPGEVQYGDVPIPGAYGSPVASPTQGQFRR